MRESDANVVLEARDMSAGEASVHKSHIKK